MSVKIAAAYIRVSTEDQLEYSPESQLRVIRDYADRSGFFVPDKYIFMDEGISGRRAEKRPAFMQMIAVAKTDPRPFDAILLWKFSRFARSRQDSIVYKSMLRKQLGIEVLSVSESLGDDKISVLIEAIIEAMDEYYSINLAEEVRRGMTEKARRGEPLSVPPFGYRLENKSLVTVPGEADVIRNVFEQYAGGKSFSRIAKTLNSMGVLTHRGGRIEGRTVEYWLNNPVYIGKLRWTPTGKTRRDYHNPDSLIVDGCHEPIIDTALWLHVQDLLSSAGPPKIRTSMSHWLVGLVRCGFCGGPMVNCRGYFYCGNKSKGSCSGASGVRIQFIADTLLSSLKDFFLDLSPITVSSCPQNCSSSSGEQLLDSALRRLQRIKDAYESGVDTIEEYRYNKSKISEEIEHIKKDLLSPPALSDHPPVPPDVADIFSDNCLSNEKKNSVLRSFVRRITLSGHEINVEMLL